MITQQEEKKLETEPQNEPIPIEGFDGLVLHPSLDLQQDVLSLGFRVRGKDRKIQNVIVVVHAGRIEIAREDTIEIAEKNISFDLKGRFLQHIEERWSLARLNKIITDYRSGKSLSSRPSEVLSNIISKLKHFIQLESELDYVLIAAWSIGTYFYPAFSAYPFLNPHAPKKSGKSQLLNVLQQICFNARKARPTPAALGDIVDSLRGTYLIDQAELLWRKGNEDLCDLLTDSYKRNGGKRLIIMYDKDKQRSPKEFDTYCPKAIASTGDIPPDLRDRLLPIRLLRSDRNFPDPDEAGDWGVIRDHLYSMLILEFVNLRTIYEVLKMQYRHSHEIIGRQLELWLPIEAVLTLTGTEKSLVLGVRAHFLQLYSTNEDEPSDLESAVMRFLLESFPNGHDAHQMSPKEIATAIDQDVFPSRIETDRQRATNVGRVLHKYNLFTDEMRIGNGKVYKFVKEHVGRVCRQYLGEGEHTEHTSTASDPFADGIKSMQDAGLIPPESV